MSEKIDFVIAYVDEEDAEWLLDREDYLFGLDKLYDSNERHKNYEILQYWFRGVEKFAPFVNKIHFITPGKLPKWLNVNHPKLNIVKHSDYISPVFLPTFCLNPVELNMHRIKELEEHFVYFNSDMFLTKTVKENDYFVNGKPVDRAIENPITSCDPYDMFPHIYLNCVGVINRHFNKKDCIEQNKEIWYSSKIGKKGVEQNKNLNSYNMFLGFYNYNLPQSFKKSILEEAWKKEEMILGETTSHKFRTIYDVNQYIFRYWQFAKGEIEVSKKPLGKAFKIDDNTIGDIVEAIEKQKYRQICINDNNKLKNFEKNKKKIQKAFESILPDKSKFEL